VAAGIVSRGVQLLAFSGCDKVARLELTEVKSEPVA